MTQNNDWLNKLIENNIIKLVIIFTSIVVGYTMINANVKANTARIELVEIKQAEFPTKEWFDLKFKTEREYVDLRFSALEKKIEDCGR